MEQRIGFLFLFSILCAATGFTQDFESLPLADLSAFSPTGKNWVIAGDVTADLSEEEALKTQKGTGILVNLPDKNHRANIQTLMEHGDLDLELEFMMARGSNSGIYLQGRYEVQLFDSWGKKSVTYGDCGGIYERWDERQPQGEKGYQGYAPRLNASRAPGLWQKLELSFRAPRFDRYGNKVENAQILSVRLNGVTIHENVELTGLTRGGMKPEVARGPLLIQGDHGPVAFRNIRYRLYDNPPLQVDTWKYAIYKYEGAGFPDLSGLSPEMSGSTNKLTAKMVSMDARFAIRLEAALPVRQAGWYRVETQVRGFSRLVVDGREVIPPTWGNGQGRVELEAGTHSVEITYYKPDSWYPTGLGVFVSGPGMRRHPLHVESAVPLSSLPAPVFVKAEPQPTMLRSFVDFKNPDDSVSHRITHAISVGYPQEISYGYNLGNGALFQVWRGGFLNATPMWNSRGNGSSRPVGSVIALGDYPTLARLENAGDTWPREVAVHDTFHPKGYRLDADGNPVYLYEAEGVAVEDHIRPANDGKQLLRILHFNGVDGSDWYVRLAAGTDIREMQNGWYVIDQQYYIQFPDKTSYRPTVRNSSEGKELIISVEGVSEVSYNLIW